MEPWQRDQLQRALEQRRDALLEELNREAARQRNAEPADAVPDACTDCGVEVGFERFEAEPAAARCIDCQRQYEKTYRR